jgi:tripartite-type tricarboxylate transporter receptor subunit TctC
MAAGHQAVCQAPFFDQIKANMPEETMTRLDPITRRVWLGAAASLCAGGSAFAAPGIFPDHAVRVVVPYATGGTSDLIIRYLGPKLTESWGQQVVVENRPGGGTVIGAQAVAHAAPDGYTLLLPNNTHVITPHLLPNLPFDPLRDFTPVATLATSAYLLLLNPKLQARNLQEFIALAKARPGGINFATHGAGGLTHVAAELLNAAAGIKMELVQYKGAGPAMTAVLGGEVDVYLDAPATTLPYIQSGQLRPIGISGRTRLPALPDVPTIAEAGLPDFEVTIWYGLLGPAGLPTAMVQKINTDIAAVLSQPELRMKLDPLGVTPFASSSEQFGRWLRDEYERYGNIIRTANIRLD